MKLVAKGYTHRASYDGFKTDVIPFVQEGVARVVGIVFAGFGDGEEVSTKIVKAFNCHDELVKALKAAVIPLERLGDFIGNTDKGGASGLGPFDRCAILLQVRDVLAKAGAT